MDIARSLNAWNQKLSELEIVMVKQPAAADTQTSRAQGEVSTTFFWCSSMCAVLYVLYCIGIVQFCKLLLAFIWLLWQLQGTE